MDWMVEAQLDNLAYWAGRTADTQQRLTNKGIKETEAQLARYFRNTQESVIKEFVATYEHLLARAVDGEVTPADLYKLNKYWQMQGQLMAELQKLGDKQAAYLAQAFAEHYLTVYENLGVAFPEAVATAAFATIDKAAASQIVNAIWCADGKSWSQRIWSNTEALREELNEKLVACVVSGKKPTQLKNDLMERFGVIPGFTSGANSKTLPAVWLVTHNLLSL